MPMTPPARFTLLAIGLLLCLALVFWEGAGFTEEASAPEPGQEVATAAPPIEEATDGPSAVELDEPVDRHSLPAARSLFSLQIMSTLGGPVAGARVEVSLVGDLEARTGVSDEQGMLEIEAPPHRIGSVFAAAPGFRSGIFGGPPPSGIIHLAPSDFTMSVVVVDRETDLPVQGALVRIAALRDSTMPLAGSLAHRTGMEAVTDGRGTAVFRGDPSFNHQSLLLEVEAEGFVTTLFERFTKDGPQVRIRLPRDRELGVALARSDGTPLGRARSWSSASLLEAEGMTDEAGWFRPSPLEAHAIENDGSAWLSWLTVQIAEDEYFTWGGGAGIQLDSPGRAETLIVPTLPPTLTCRIEGRTTEGYAITVMPALQVDVLRSMSLWRGPPIQWTAIKEGEQLLEVPFRLKSNRAYALLRSPSGQIVEVVEIHSGQEEVVFAGGPLAELVVRGMDGSDKTLSLIAHDAKAIGPVSELPVGGLEQVSISIPPGSYDLELAHGLSRLVRRSIEVQRGEGAVVTLPGRKRMEGTLTGSLRGPLAGAFLRAEIGEWTSEAYADSAGRFSLLVPDSGGVIAMGMFSYAPPSHRREVGELYPNSRAVQADAGTLDWVVPECRLRLVMDAPADHPDLRLTLLNSDGRQASIPMILHHELATTGLIVPTSLRGYRILAGDEVLEETLDNLLEGGSYSFSPRLTD